MSEEQTAQDDEQGARATVARAYSRRGVLRAALGLAGAAALAACGGTGGATPAAGTTPPPGGGANQTPTAAAQPTRAATRAATTAAAASTPTRAAVEGLVPSGVAGVPDAFTRPPTLVKSVPSAPAKGGKVSMYSIGYNPPVPGRNENQFWQELEKRLGTTWEPNITPQAEYGAKAATLVAGGELPDLFYVNPGQNAAALSKTVEQGAFTDLTPLLEGDALKEYPNLVVFDPTIWKNVRVKNKIYGVPKPIPRANNIPFFRNDWAKKLGKGAPKNAEEVYDFFTAFAKGDPDGNGTPDTWAFGGLGGADLMPQMFRTPNAWRQNPDGSLTATLETEENKQAFAFMRRLWEGGAYHPDAPTITNAQMVDLVLAGKLGVRTGGYRPFFGSTGVRGRVKEQNPNAELVGLVPPGHDGGKGVTYLGPGFFGYVAIPARVGRDRERAKELLRVMNYLAAPFGTEEYDFLTYGVAGVHHEPQPDGRRTVNEKGRGERGDLVYMLHTAEVAAFFYPDAPGEAEYAQNLAKEMLAVGIENPTQGLFSTTATAKGAELTQLSTDRTVAIITGREPFSAYDQWVRDWKSRAGDQIRKELEEEIKNNR
jgi:putative aldouronate transport system substrate-binding protein